MIHVLLLLRVQDGGAEEKPCQSRTCSPGMAQVLQCLLQPSRQKELPRAPYQKVASSVHSALHRRRVRPPSSSRTCAAGMMGHSW